MEVYSNNYIKSKSKSKHKKVVVFDLDETIGSFGELYLLWNNIIVEKNQTNFNNLLDLYPEFLRYGIMNIVDYLKYKKNSGGYFKTFIYTNNQFSQQWVTMIINYIESKQNAVGLFDQIICGFNKSIDCMRTTKNKTHSDFIRCSVLPRTTEICFIDDTYFNKMEHSTVYYIQPKRFYHSMKTSDIIGRIANSSLVNDTDSLYLEFINRNMLNTISKSQSEVDTDILVSQKIMYHIKEFFIMSTRKEKTRNNRYKLVGRFTRKRL